MILKIVEYYIILFGTLFVMRSIVKMMAPMTSASLMFFIYLSSYLILLGLEIRLQLLRKATDKEIKKAPFRFSFWACVGFGILITFYQMGIQNSSLQL